VQQSPEACQRSDRFRGGADIEEQAGQAGSVAIDPLRTPITQLVSAVEEVERRVDFLELALDFRALARTEIFLQPLQQSLLSRNEFWNDSQKGWLCSFIG
jgi:hypothetical protein